MIIPMRWRNVTGGMRVRLSSGRVVAVLPRIASMPTMAMLRINRDAPGGTRPVTVDPDAYADVVFDEIDIAAATLRQVFPDLEYIREL